MLGSRRSAETAFDCSAWLSDTMSATPVNEWHEWNELLVKKYHKSVKLFFLSWNKLLSFTDSLLLNQSPPNGISKWFNSCNDLIFTGLYHYFLPSWKCSKDNHHSRASCQKGPTHHAYAWRVGPFWLDTLAFSIMGFLSTWSMKLCHFTDSDSFTYMNVPIVAHSCLTRHIYWSYI